MGNALPGSHHRFQIPESRRGVPTLIIDHSVLVGSIEIPEQFPVLVDCYLSQGGVDWPDLPGLTEAEAVSPPERSTDQQGEPAMTASTPSLS